MRRRQHVVGSGGLEAASEEPGPRHVALEARELDHQLVRRGLGQAVRGEAGHRAVGPHVGAAVEHAEETDRLALGRREEHSPDPVRHPSRERAAVARHPTLGDVLDPVSVVPPCGHDGIGRRRLADLRERVPPRVVHARQVGTRRRGTAPDDRDHDRRAPREERRGDPHAPGVGEAAGGDHAKHPAMKTSDRDPEEYPERRHQEHDEPEAGEALRQRRQEPRHDDEPAEARALVAVDDRQRAAREERQREEPHEPPRRKARRRDEVAIEEVAADQHGEVPPLPASLGKQEQNEPQPGDEEVERSLEQPRDVGELRAHELADGLEDVGPADRRGGRLRCRRRRGGERAREHVRHGADRAAGGGHRHREDEASRGRPGGVAHALAPGQRARHREQDGRAEARGQHRAREYPTAPRRGVE